MFMEKQDKFMKKSVLVSRKTEVIFGILGILFLWGGIYDFSAAVYGLLLAIGMIYLSVKNRKWAFPIDATAGCLLIMMLCHVFSAFLARDKGMAIIGCVRMGVICLFWIFWCNVSENSRKTVWQSIPETASIMTVISIIGYFIPELKKLLYAAERLGGFFQYANTCALFLLLALIILMYRENKSKREYAECVILGIGIIFCGSRSVVVISGILLLVFLVRGHGNKKILGIVVIAAVGIGAVLQLLMKLDLNRLFILSLNSSTLNGRLLYWRDALSIIVKRPMGLGYMGYYYLQPQFQTGVYTTKFVHNDFLQYALDAGIICAAALVCIMLKGLFNKKSSRQKRVVLAVLSLHCLFDFDLQFLSMFCLLLMCIETEQSKIKICSVKKMYLEIGLTGICYVYFSIALGLAQFNLNDKALWLYPLNTEARLAVMQERDDAEAAEKVIRQNGMAASAYECAAENYISEAEYVKAYENLESMLQCAGYNIYYYNQYVYYLSYCLDQAVQNKDYNNGQKILEAIQNTPEKIDKLKNKVSFFAYRINDKPVLNLEVEVEAYIKNLSGLKLYEK